MRTVRFGRALVGALCVVLVAGGVVGLTATGASAAACDVENPSRGDLDGDGASDVIVGMPWAFDGAGAVDLRYTANPDRMLHTGDLTGSPDDADQVGSAMAVGDLDGDGCADLVVGAPGEGTGQSGQYTGQVHIVRGAPGGVDTGTAITLSHGSSAPFDRFGAALALTLRPATGDVLTHDLYVGAPDATVGGRAHAGEVFRYTITSTGPGRPLTVAEREVRSQDSPGVPGAAETNDRFGSVLAAVDAGRGVVVGDPGEDVGSASNAGAVWYLPVDTAGAATAALTLSQDTAGVPGAAENGDHFGVSVSARGSVVGVGVSGENDANRKDSGMVELLVVTAGGTVRHLRAITQASRGIPGALEAGDRFGAQVQVGAALLCQENLDVAVGSPGEDVGSRTDAGTVTLIGQTAGSGCRARVLRQGSGLAGAAEDGDAVGSVLALTRGRTDLDEDYRDRLLIGVPLEDIGAKTDAGLVEPGSGGITANSTYLATLQYPGGYLLGDRYGMVLTSASD